MSKRTNERTDGRRKNERMNGPTVCGMEKIVREKSECSYQSAMQTRGFASVMPSSANEGQKKGAAEGNRAPRDGGYKAPVNTRGNGSRSILIIVPFNIGAWGREGGSEAGVFLLVST